ncbi:hypothetical protein J4733_18695 [Klebsiella pneumoniae]|uniref:Uncharacterized protein n=1 Tax=Klebsiella pneumoniae TaxID=573 RepID=A0A939SRY6_KLEPN|nr:hypothetical protein [Klebsiella pneumoniae]
MNRYGPVFLAGWPVSVCRCWPCSAAFDPRGSAGERAEVRKSPPQVSTNDDAQPLADPPIAASHNIFLLTRQRRLSGWYSSGSDCLEVRAQRRRAMALGTASRRVAAAPYPAYVRTTCR